MAIGEIDTRTPEEILKELKERQKDHVFMTTEEARAWNEAQPKTPLSKSHWSVKAAKIKHTLRMAANWKQLAKALWNDLRESRAEAAQFEAEAMSLSRMMVYCDKCKSAPGEECGFKCTRDGSRDVE